MIENVKKIKMLALLKHLKLVSWNSPEDVRFNCLFHQSKSGLSAEINYQNKVWCWSCGTTFDVIDVYQRHTCKSLPASIKKLEEFMNSSEYQLLINQDSFLEEKIKNKQQKINKKINYDEKSNLIIKKKIVDKVSFQFNQIKRIYHQELLNHLEGLIYLKSERKLTMKTIKDFELGVANKNNQFLVKYLNQNQLDENKFVELGLIKQNKKFIYDALVDCLVIPINYKEHTMHFFSHNYHNPIDRFNPKYQALKNFSHTNIFYWPYGFTKAYENILKEKQMILHEGFFDVMSCHQNGIKNAVGIITITSYLSETVLRFLKKHEIKILIAFDNDKAGEKNALRIKKQLEEKKIINEIKKINKKYLNNKNADDILSKYNVKTY
ncbi:toprim domain-containing protein [Candidatus Phytoplasma sacchari]|uniref:Toprim domain-containing protein n=1 Tax=Candidatus Phytoplasma sacchari TaxID=2609813 RepID=A0ABY7M1R1_9MOLU|nr:toprim domain-containing protein [Candidatus Phytoplasma sacchari]